MNEKKYNILFLCTGNSARSIMAEALVNSLGQGRFRAYSAGSNPTGTVNPFAIEMVNTLHLPNTELRSKKWDEFSEQNAPQMDFIITVCGNAANEICPIWPGHPTTAHWGFEDPAAVVGSDNLKRQSFQDIFKQIETRIQLFLALPFDSLDEKSLLQAIRAIALLEK